MILACSWIIISFLVIKSTYAKYLTKVDSDANVGIASWKIKVNTQDIMNNSDFSNNMSFTFPGDTYRKQNYAVPGATGYFDIDVDSSEVNIQFKYTVTCTFPSGNDVTDLKVTGFSVNRGGTIYPYTNDSSTPIVNYLTPTANSGTLRVYVQWVDGTATENLNDVNDTSLALSSGKAKVQANVRFEQTHN